MCEVCHSGLSVCDQWDGVMEAVGASERIIDYLDAPSAPQLAPGRVVPNFTGRVSTPPASLPSRLGESAESVLQSGTMI